MKNKLFGIIETIAQGDKKKVYRSYTVLFIFGFILFYFGMAVQAKSFIWRIDGLEQQYPFFILESQWLHDLCHNIFVDHVFELPLWNPLIGYGADYYLSISATLGNPLNLISFFSTPQNAEMFLNLTVPVTLYLAGLSFLKYCVYKKFDNISSLLGSLIYVFSGFSIVAFSQIFMLYSLVLVPYIILGADKIFDRKSPTSFIVALSLSFIYAVSFAYMACLCLLVYCVVRYAYSAEKKSVKSFLSLFFRFAICLILAFMISAFIFLPNAMSILSQNRLNLDRPSDLFYPLRYYINLAVSFVGYTSVGADCFIGFAPVCVLGIIVSFVKNDSAQNKVLRMMFIVMTIFLCLPVFGRIFNGFAYPNNRWVWAYVFLVSIMTAANLPALYQSDSGFLKKCTFIAIVYAIAAFLIYGFIPNSSSDVFGGLALLAFTLCALICLCKNSRLLIAGIFALTFTAFGFQYIQFAHNNYQNMVGLSSAYRDMVEDHANSLITTQNDITEWRFDTARIFEYRNSNIPLKAAGTTFYNSIYNSAIDEYHTHLGLVSSPFNFSYTTLDARSTMDALAGVKYFIIPKNEERFKPSMFDDHILDGKAGGVEYSLYETSHLLPLAFMYDNALSSTAFAQLSPMESQDALLEAIVLNNPRNEKDYDHENIIEIPFSLTTQNPEEKSVGRTEGLPIIERNTITTLNPDSVVYLDANLPKDAEIYIEFEGLKYSSADSQNENPSSLLSAFVNMRDAVQEALMNANGNHIIGNHIYVETEEIYQDISLLTNYSHLYAGKDDWACNLSGTKESEHIKIRFAMPGTYTFEAIKIQAIRNKDIIQDIDMLADKGASDCGFSYNEFSCRVNAQENNRYLFFRIPYSQGWTAEVDGDETLLHQANLGFMAIEIEPGQHDIVLRYATPGLQLGVILSLAGIVLAGLYISINNHAGRCRLRR